MKDFDRLNWETNNYKATDVRRTASTSTTVKYGTPEYWANYWNNQTYKANNGQYSKRYY